MRIPSPRQRSILPAFVLTALAIGCATGRQYQLTGLSGSSQGLSRLTFDADDELGASLSADGQTLLFDTRLGKTAAIVGIEPATGARRSVYTSTASRAQEPTWDPTGRFFMYTSNSTGSWSLVRSLANSPSAAVSIVLSGEMAPLVSDPDISPDGRRVAVATRIRAVWQVAVVNMDGSAFTMIGEGVDPAWSPDGKRIAFVRRSNNRAQIFTVDANTGTDVVQVTTGDFDSFSPAWSPSGDRLVFSSNRSSRRASRTYDDRTGGQGTWATDPFHLYVVRPDGTDLIQLTDGDARNIHPFWGKDGWVYFSSNQAGNFDIWRLKFAPGAVATITQAGDSPQRRLPECALDAKRASQHAASVKPFIGRTVVVDSSDFSEPWLTQSKLVDVSAATLMLGWPGYAANDANRAWQNTKTAIQWAAVDTVVIPVTTSAPVRLVLKRCTARPGQ